MVGKPSNEFRSLLVWKMEGSWDRGGWEGGLGHRWLMRIKEKINHFEMSANNGEE